MLNFMRQTVVISLFFLLGNTSVHGQVKKIPVNRLKIAWEIIANHHENENKFLSAFTLTNNASRPLPESGWSLYFNFVRSVDVESVTGNVAIEYINGDLFRLYPKPTFAGLGAGESLRIPFVSSDWAINVTDAPAGLYWVWDDKPDSGITIDNYHIIPSSRPEQFRRSPDDNVAPTTPQKLFEQNTRARDMDESELVKVFPTPVAYKENPGLFMITETTTIVADPDFDKVADYLIEEIYWIIGKRPHRSVSGTTRNCIVLRKAAMAKEAYSLRVDATQIAISASEPSGIFYGIQSLKTLIPPVTLETVRRYAAIPAVEVIDEPRFPHRAIFLDVARNFQSRQQVKKLIDVMALYKLNVLHLHLNDDEGWRLEIPGLPELTEVGSRRGHTHANAVHLPPSFGSGPNVLNAYGSGYYSREDFIDILRYATTRFVTVIPEIETPGHARAAIKSMEVRYRRYMDVGAEKEAREYLLRHPDDKSQYKSVQGWNDNVMDPGMESTYAFLEHVVDEVRAMYHDAKAPLNMIHFGGDEVPAGAWEISPPCLSVIDNNPAVKGTADLWYYFFDRVNRMLASKDLSLYGWEEIALRKIRRDGKDEYVPNRDFVDQSVHVDVWNNVAGWGSEDLAYRLANAGYKVVLSCVSHLYFDMAYYKSFDEPGYYWGAYVDVDKPFSFIPYDYFTNLREDRLGNPIDKSAFREKEQLTDQGKTNIVGIQGLLWAETIRGPERMEYHLLPKLLGLAERAWAAEPRWATETDSVRRNTLYREAWSAFANILGKRELPRLDYYHSGYKYRIPSPGGIVRNNRVEANIQLPGFVIRYTTDGKEPTIKSRIYNGPINSDRIVKLRAFNREGRSSKTTTVPIRGN